MESLNLIALIASLVGTTVMLALLKLLSITHAVEGDLLHTLGAILMRREHRTHLLGLVVHYTFGISFGFIYTNLVMLAEPESNLAVIFMCLAMGLVHGIFSTLVLIGIAQRHPSKRFRESPVPGSLAHGVAHLAYGLSVGLVLVALGRFAEAV